MYCPKCGRENPEFAKFCSGCGELLVFSESSKPKNGKRTAVTVLACVFFVILTVALIVISSVGSRRDRVTAVTHPDFDTDGSFVLSIKTKKDSPSGYTEISTAKDIEKIKDDPDGKYILMDDIKMKDSFETIEEFGGILDGNGYTLSNLKHTLVYEADGAVVKNLGIECDINGEEAALAEYFKNGSVDNCYVDGSVVNEEGDAAGLVAFATASSLKNCCNLADVTANYDHAAGIVGYICEDYLISNCVNYGEIVNLGEVWTHHAAGIVAAVSTSGTVSGCMNSGTVRCIKADSASERPYEGTHVACGIVGISKYIDVTVERCVNRGKIEGGDFAFGIAMAWSEHGEDMIVRDCLNVGEFTIDTSYGIAGQLGPGKVTSVRIENCVNVSESGDAAISNNSEDIENCYYLDEVRRAVSEGSGKAKKLTSGEMSDKKSFELDFENVWQMEDGHPELGRDSEK